MIDQALTGVLSKYYLLVNSIVLGLIKLQLLMTDKRFFKNKISSFKQNNLVIDNSVKQPLQHLFKVIINFFDIQKGRLLLKSDI